MIREAGTSKEPASDNRKPANRSGVTLAKTRAKGDPKKPREVLAGKPLLVYSAIHTAMRAAGNSSRRAAKPEETTR